MAQLVAHLLCKQGVRGSSPLSSTFGVSPSSAPLSEESHHLTLTGLAPQSAGTDPRTKAPWLRLNGDISTLPSARESLLVRVEFSNDAAWQQAMTAATATNDDGFCADLHPVDDPSNQGASLEELVRAVPDSSYRMPVMFVVDQEAMSGEYPIVVVDLVKDRPPFRCIAAELWCVENNLSLSTMDRGKFASAVDPTGVFRGFR